MAEQHRGRGRPAAGDESTLATEVVLDAALEAFAERGFDGTSVREIARDLGVSHNLIPQRIGSKEQLWFAAVDHGFGELNAALLEVAAAHAPDPTDPTDDVAQLRALVVGFIEANARRPALLRIINQEAAADGARLDHIFTNYMDPVRRFGEALMDRLAVAGQLRTRSVSLMYFLMTHGAGGPVSLPGLAARFGQVVDPTDAEAVHRHAVEVATVIFDGLLLPPGDN